MEYLQRLIEPLDVPWLTRNAGVIVAAIVVPLGYWLVSVVLPLFVKKGSRTSVRTFFRTTRGAAQALLILIVLYSLAGDRLAETVPLGRTVLPPAIALFAAILIHRFVAAFFILLQERFDLNATDNLRARKATTQIVVLRRVVAVLIYVVGISVALMTVPDIRQYGASLLASAGLAGLVLGLAAQQTLSNILAGIQIAITQPLRIDDAVVIDGEWGRVEEITLTYVVVRIWDLRRQVVPISYLLQKPFQNWTRSSSRIIGTVYLHVDYTIDLDALRGEQTRLLASSEHWDGDVDVVQVTDSTEQTIQIRSLMSAASSSAAWDLRCEIREGLIRFLQGTQPDALPRQRMKLQGTIRNRND